MSAITPDTSSMQSFVRGQQPDASVTEAAITSMATEFTNGREQAKKAGLLDQSLCKRTGFRGLSASQHLISSALPVPGKPNQMSVSANGELVLRLSQKEFWVLESLTEQKLETDIFNLRGLPEKDCYSLFCQDSHAWLIMTGDHLAETMSKVCGVDLREQVFPTGSIAQTSAARINVIVISHEVNGIPCFSILCDSAAAEYLWESLLDAMAEFGGEEILASALL